MSAIIPSPFLISLMRLRVRCRNAQDGPLADQDNGEGGVDKYPGSVNAHCNQREKDHGAPNPTPLSAIGRSEQTIISRTH